ncbi:MAG: hypothetical protein K940chlam7_01726 [Chlamydiae bacterium]|nr:hypothetical protein [Chlamydiota bacterium]
MCDSLLCKTAALVDARSILAYACRLIPGSTVRVRLVASSVNIMEPCLSWLNVLRTVCPCLRWQDRCFPNILPFPVVMCSKQQTTRPLRSVLITKTSSLLRVVPPPCCTLILSLLWDFHLSFSLNIATTLHNNAWTKWEVNDTVYAKILF